MSDTRIVKKLAAAIRKTMRQGPRAMRLPGQSHTRRLPNEINGHAVWGRTPPGGGHDTFAPGDAYRLLLEEDAEHPRSWSGPSLRSAWPLANRLFKRAMKKAGQPHRKNHNRKRMQRRAAGKNEVLP